MEAIRTTEGEWSSSLGSMYSAEEADFMAQLLGGFSFTNDHQGHEGSCLSLPSTFWPSHEISNVPTSSDDLHHSSDHHSSNNLSDPLYFSQESCTSNPSTEMILSDPFHSTFPDHQNGSYQFFPTNNDLTESLGLLSTDNLIQLDGQCIEGEDPLALPNVDKDIYQNENSKKRSHKADVNIEKAKRNVKSKKNLKIVPPACNVEEDVSRTNGPGSSSCSSEDESNAASEEVANGGDNSSLSPKVSPSLNANGKTRASRGSATDPQSLYARKRRERINERLRILQNLVPNGTKVDISTMLEEAVQYVKFLQLQIKLLSSDDLWMYAPLAYNGMDIGIDLKTPLPK